MCITYLEYNNTLWIILTILSIGGFGSEGGEGITRWLIPVCKWLAELKFQWHKSSTHLVLCY